MLLRIALMVRVRKFGGGHCYKTMKREWKMLAREVWVWDDWMDERLGEVGKMLINMTMMVKKRQTQQTKQRHRNDVRANLKGERSQKVKNMAVTVKDLSIKTWWRSLVTYRWISLVGATCDTLSAGEVARNHFENTEKSVETAREFCPSVESDNRPRQKCRVGKPERGGRMIRAGGLLSRSPRARPLSRSPRTRRCCLANPPLPELKPSPPGAAASTASSNF